MLSGDGMADFIPSSHSTHLTPSFLIHYLDDPSFTGPSWFWTEFQNVLWATNIVLQSSLLNCLR